MMLAILGENYPRTSKKYKGVGRQTPSYIDRLPDDHEVNLLYWELVEKRDNNFLVNDLGLAKRAIKLYKSLQPSQFFELIEITSSDNQPQSGNYDFLGYDIACDYSVSTLAMGLNADRIIDSINFTLGDNTLIPFIRLIDVHFTPLLNDFGLFQKYEDAQFCFEVQMALQKIRPNFYESSNCKFEILGIWRIKI